jgi:hypothetical protein
MNTKNDWQGLTHRQKGQAIRLKARYVITPAGWTDKLKIIFRRLLAMDLYGLFSGMPMVSVRQEIDRIERK